jgi:excisionase family DNA binding protein
MSEAEPILPRLLTLEQVAEYLGVCDRTLSNYRKQGMLRAVRYQGKVRIDERDLAAFINGHKLGGEGA